ncbi:hypothetical protein KSS87_000282 [Heliosperma pusillum]|nr:hypothetical protein KSS87_000282 [Heliosperma pusillum]
MQDSILIIKYQKADAMDYYISDIEIGRLPKGFTSIPGSSRWKGSYFG